MGRAIPEMVTCPNEMVAMSAAHGHAQVSGRAQAVLVHVECGTQSLAGAVHNAAKGRVPVLIFAGLSPFTQEGELRGQPQRVHPVDPGRLRPARHRARLHEVRRRAAHGAATSSRSCIARCRWRTAIPRDRCISMGAREVMEEEAPPVTLDNAAMAADRADGAVGRRRRRSGADCSRRGARWWSRPIVGRNPGGGARTGALLRSPRHGRAGIGAELAQYPAPTIRCIRAITGTIRSRTRRSRQADVVLVLDSDVPWIPTGEQAGRDARASHHHQCRSAQAADAAVVYRSARRRLRADAATALRQLNRSSRSPRRRRNAGASAARTMRRCMHERARRNCSAREAGGRPRDHAGISDRLRAAASRGKIRSCVSEGITNYHVDHRPHRARRFRRLVHQRRRLARLERRRGDRHEAGGAGKDGGRAHRRRLLHVLRAVHACTGWRGAIRRRSCRSSSTIAAGRRRNSRRSRCIPKGYASRANELDTSLRSAAGLCRHRAGRGRRACGVKVRATGGDEPAIAEALRVVREERRAAVLDVWLPAL